MSNVHIRFQNNDDSDYQPSDSEDDYSENEKHLLQKVRNKGQDDSDSEDEVYGLESEEDSDDEDKSDIALSDVEGQDEDDGLPDARAWGKKKKDFYSTDYVDPDYGGFQGKDAVLAELEEEEAGNIQKQLAQELDDNDFSAEIIVKKTESKNKKNLEETTLLNQQKLQLLKQQSPEFFDLIKDFKVKMILAKDTLKPILELSKSNAIQKCEALNFIQYYYELILNYCVNISMYLLLKVSGVAIKNYPITKTLSQYRQHLSKMESIFEEVIQPQLEIIMNLQVNVSNSVKKKKTLKLLTNLNNKAIKDKNVNKDVEDEPPKKKSKKDTSSDKNENEENVKIQINSSEGKFASNYDSSDSGNEIEDKEDDEEDQDIENTNERRAITYQMAKNKGLKPYRKKEQRNPRVKHRNKFRKAKIRRKGAVREVRKELARYGGEISGIKASVTKSIKIKG